MKHLLVLTLLLSSTMSLAQEISCTRDDDADDWNISGKLGGREINLFDNDSDSTFRLKGVLESLPPIYVYQEVSDPETTIRIKPSRDNRSATAQYISGRSTIKFTCSVGR